MMERCRIKGKNGIKATKLKVMPRKLCLAPHLTCEFYWLRCLSLISSWEVKRMLKWSVVVVPGLWNVVIHTQKWWVCLLELPLVLFQVIPSHSSGLGWEGGSFCLPGKLRIGLFSIGFRDPKHLPKHPSHHCLPPVSKRIFRRTTLTIFWDSDQQKTTKKSTKIMVIGHFRVLVMAASRLCLMRDREGSQGLNPAWNCFVWNNEVSPECGYRKNPTKTWCGCAIKKTPIISISRAEFLQTLPLIPSDQPDKKSAWKSRSRTWRTLAIRTQGKSKILPPTFQLFPRGVSPPTSLDPTCLSTGICW